MVTINKMHVHKLVSITTHTNKQTKNNQKEYKNIAKLIDTIHTSPLHTQPILIVEK